MGKQKGEIRIYVACLAAYNNGWLHGRWIDATQGKEAIQTEIADILEASPISDAEEWAIHDYEGFEGAPLSEYQGIESVAEPADFIALWLPVLASPQNPWLTGPSYLLGLCPIQIPAPRFFR